MDGAELAQKIATATGGVVRALPTGSVPTFAIVDRDYLGHGFRRDTGEEIVVYEEGMHKNVDMTLVPAE